MQLVVCMSQNVCHTPAGVYVNKGVSLRFQKAGIGQKSAHSKHM